MHTYISGVRSERSGQPTSANTLPLPLDSDRAVQRVQQKQQTEKNVRLFYTNQAAIINRKLTTVSEVCKRRLARKKGGGKPLNADAPM